MKECGDKELSGIDERPKITRENFKRLCPACQNMSTLYIKHDNADPRYRSSSWYDRVGYLEWRSYSAEIVAALSDRRTTPKSIEKHQFLCECGYNFAENPTLRMRFINLFRSNVKNHSWERAEERRLESERDR